MSHVAPVPLRPAAAAVFALALLGALACGREAESPTSPEPGQALAAATTTLAFRQVSAGSYHTCGVTTDDRAFCWGKNSYGALGDGTTTNRSLPVAVAGGLPFLEVRAGSSYTCGVTTAYKAYCWGQNANGNLGDGTTENRLTPVAVAGRHLFRQVRPSSGSHTCGVTPKDEAFCWGDNRWGQLGDSTPATRRLTPVRVKGGLSFRRVVPGGLHTCGETTDFHAYCWGDGTYGAIGDGTTARRRWPRAVAGGLLFRQVVGGSYHTCGVTRDDRAYCWGWNRLGELGDGTLARRLVPVPVAGGLTFSGVSAGADHSCGVTLSGAAWCWGYNLYGQLGDGTRDQRLTPVAVSGGLQFVYSGVSAGGNGSFTCGIIKGYQAWCWGGRFDGQLGDGFDNGSTTVPGPVISPP